MLEKQPSKYKPKSFCNSVIHIKYIWELKWNSLNTINQTNCQFRKIVHDILAVTQNKNTMFRFKIKIVSSIASEFTISRQMTVNQIKIIVLHSLMSENPFDFEYPKNLPWFVLLQLTIVYWHFCYIFTITERQGDVHLSMWIK